MYRHEKKYIINNLQVEQIKHRLSPIMQLDPNIKNNKFYSIRSLYFDDCFDTNFKQVINGVSKRFKYRIRFYNNDDSYIVLEKKFKINNMAKKISCKLTREDVINILNNNININKDNHKLLNEFYLMIKTKGYKPKIIIDYDRIPFVYNAGNVRITIDYNLSCSYKFDNLFDVNINKIPLMDMGYSILEIKYDNFIPDYIRFALQLNELNRTTYSKYGNGRIMLNKVGGFI
ncbi:MAG: polyphosphate polymerase domain-containing protein [Bacilli bacterium]|nr:polyphosphate polymerase domain-containing protein [Bacilli bacterium]